MQVIVFVSKFLRPNLWQRFGCIFPAGVRCEDFTEHDTLQSWPATEILAGPACFECLQPQDLQS